MSDKKLARNYQVELLNKALHQNAIVYLGTGAGKTFIATMLIKEKMADVLNGGKKTVFLVHRVPLVTQQAKFIAENTPLKVRSFSGADNVDFWNEATWKKEIEKHQVLVMIHDVFKLALDHCTHFFNLTMVNLLIVDECHHSMGNSSYNQIFKGHYHPLPKDQRPHVLALTASIVTKKVTSLESFAKEKALLEEVLDSKVITTENLGDLLKYATQPHEEVRVFCQPSALVEVNQIIAAGLDDLEEVKNEELMRISKSLLDIPRKVAIDDAGSMFKKFKRILAQTDKSLCDLGIFHGHKLLELSEVFVKEELLSNADNPLKAKLARSTGETLSRLRKCIGAKIDEFHDQNELQKFQLLSTDKVIQLVNILETFKLTRPSSPDMDGSGEEEIPLKAIIFVQERQIAAALASLLSWLAEMNKPALGHLKVSYIVGGNTSKMFKEPGQKLFLELAEKEQLRMEQTLREFRGGLLNCLVSTSVLEEGIDITLCNLVIRFDRIQEFRSYVQSKGRARAKPSKYIIMVEAGEDHGKWKADHGQYQKIEKMQIEKCHYLLESDDEDSDEDDEEPYYVNPDDQTKSPRITGLTATSLLCRYVQSLPADRFTKLVPYFEFNERKNLGAREKLMAGLFFDSSGTVTTTLHMPHLTPYRVPFVGEAKSNRKRAKRSAALIACKRLHRDGLLDDQLLPRKRVLDIFLDELDCGTSRQPKTGTKRSRRYYEKSVPVELKFQPRSTFWLYKINLKLVEASNYTQNVKQYSIYEPQKFPRKLGIIVGKRLPGELDGSPFDIFTMSGRVEVSIVLVGEMVWPNDEKMHLAQDFHFYALENVIGFNQTFVKRADTEDDLLIVPLDAGSKLDVEFLEKWSSRHNEPLKSNVFQEERYLDAVIVPKHRSNMGNFFVEEIVMEKTPKSLIPNHTSQTFLEHYKGQYGCQITNLDQPLLRISNADKHHFMFAPVTPNDEEAIVQDREKFLSKRTLFIPELVEIHPIPASLWREIQMIPFVIERLSSLVKVHEFIGKLMPSLGNACSLESSRRKAKIKFDVLIGTERSHEKVRPFDILEAVTLKGAGEAFNMEQLEILGDSFLKYFVSLGLFCNKTISKGDEGFLTQYRSSLVGNKRLFLMAVAKNIPGIMSSNKFEPHLNWMPPRFTVDVMLEKMLIGWDEEFRASILHEQIREEEDAMDEEKPMKKKLATAKVTLFQMMTESDYERISKPEFQGKEEFLKEMRYKVTKNIIPDGKSVQPRLHCLMSDKSVADVVEALIGVNLLKGGQEVAAKFMAWIGLRLSPQDSISDIISYEQNSLSSRIDWFANLSNVMPKSSLWLVQNSSGYSIDFSETQEQLDFFMRKANVVQIQEQIGYVFKEKSFLLQALTHSSYYLNKLTDSYERLEFLGDAILDFLMTCHLLSLDKTFSPGQITDLRSALVNNNTLAGIAVDSGFHRHLLQQSPELFKRINDYVAERSVICDKGVSTPKATLDNLELNNEEDCPEYEQIEVPKALGDVIESLIGAVFLDSNCCLETTWKVIVKLYGDDEIMAVVKKRPKNFVAQLYELFPERVEFSNPTVKRDKVYVTVSIFKSLSRDQAMYFRGIGLNKKAAKYAAAKCAINELKKRKII